MIHAGRKREPIDFERATTARNTLGVIENSSWASLGIRLASVSMGTGGERRQSAAEQATQAATFTVLADTVAESVTPSDRINWDGLTWDIGSIMRRRPPSGPAEIEFTAIASRD